MSILHNCPFCHDTDFDLIGLKLHFIRGHCAEFNETPTNDPPRQASPSEGRDS
jgi:hypothetical protein